MNDRNARDRIDEASQLSTQSSGNSPGVALAQASSNSAYNLPPVVATRVGLAIASAANSADRGRPYSANYDGPAQSRTAYSSGSRCESSF